jgi:hypothetical protein
MKTEFAMSGDLGDVIFSLRIAHQINDPEATYYLTDRPFTKAWNKARLDALIPLLEAQPYIDRAIHGEPIKASHDMTDFRQVGHPFFTPLADLHAKWLGMELPDYTPWLTAEPNPDFEGKVIIHRSPRYHNMHFPWQRIIDHFGDRVVAVGLPEEHAMFERFISRKIPLIQTENYLECAEILTGCSLFIGNQSSPCAIAIGLGIPVIQETSPRVPDCVYTGANAFYAAGAHVEVDGITIGTPLRRHIDRNVIPPGGWRLNGKSNTTFSTLVTKSGLPKEEAEQAILEETTAYVREKYPTFQPDPQADLLKKLSEINPPGGVKTNLTAA